MRVPRGFRDILPTEARELHAIERRLMEAFGSYGYVPLEPPAVEFASPTLDERRVLRFLDRDGRLLALRPDVTTAVARVVAQRYHGADRPLRLSYYTTVFREEQSMRGSEREYDQAGVELVGVAGLRADAEVVTLLVDALAAAGLASVDLDVGHVGYLAGFLAELTPDARLRVAEAARRGDLVSALGDPGWTAPRRVALERGLRHRGAIDVKALAADVPAASVVALEELARLAPLLAAARGQAAPRVRFDLGFVPALPYYSGVVFQVTAPGLGFAVAAGGRYDGALPALGALPATGFGIAVPHLHQALVAAGWSGVQDGTLVALLPAADDAVTLSVAVTLRGLGLAVAIDDVAENAGRTVARARAVDRGTVEYEGHEMTLDELAVFLKARQ